MKFPFKIGSYFNEYQYYLQESLWAVSSCAGCRSSRCTLYGHSVLNVSRLSCFPSCSGSAIAIRPSILASTHFSAEIFDTPSRRSSANVCAHGGRTPNTSASSKWWYRRVWLLDLEAPSTRTIQIHTPTIIRINPTDYLKGRLNRSINKTCWYENIMNISFCCTYIYVWDDSHHFCCIFRLWMYWRCADGPQK